MVKKLGPAMSWDDVAVAYEKHIGGTPRIKPIDSVFDAVAKLSQYHVDDKEGTIHEILKS